MVTLQTLGIYFICGLLLSLYTLFVLKDVMRAKILMLYVTILPICGILFLIVLFSMCEPV